MAKQLKVLLDGTGGGGEYVSESLMQGKRWVMEMVIHLKTIISKRKLYVFLDINT